MNTRKPAMPSILWAAITHEENKLKSLPPEERQKGRTKKVRPLVDAFFAWIQQVSSDRTVLLSDKTVEGINYCKNQEQYLRTFLEDGEVPMDNKMRKERSGDSQSEEKTG